MKLKKTATTYYKVMLPTSATETKLLSTEEKLPFRCERVSEGSKRSYVRLTLVKK
jgi:hypothetical protein